MSLFSSRGGTDEEEEPTDYEEVPYDATAGAADVGLDEADTNPNVRPVEA
jgi:hypothetical protein